MSAEWNPSDSARRPAGRRLRRRQLERQARSPRGPGSGPRRRRCRASRCVRHDAAGIGDDNQRRDPGRCADGDLGNRRRAGRSSRSPRTARARRSTLIDFDSGAAAALDIPGSLRGRPDDAGISAAVTRETGCRASPACTTSTRPRPAPSTRSVGALAIRRSRPRARCETESYAAFADVSFDFTDALSASLGGRWTQRRARQGTVYRAELHRPGLAAVRHRPPRFRACVRSDYTNERTFEEFTPARQRELRLQRRLDGLRCLFRGLQVRRLRHARRRRTHAGHGQRLRPRDCRFRTSSA